MAATATAQTIKLISNKHKTNYKTFDNSSDIKKMDAIIFNIKMLIKNITKNTPISNKIYDSIRLINILKFILEISINFRTLYFINIT